MSTDKFNIHEMSTGNDTHSNVLRRLGYGDLLNRPGRQEITLDTASMYKKANDDTRIGPSTMLGTGVGAVAGGIGGAELAGAVGGSATSRLLGALIGAGAGGIGGYYLGKYLDTPEDGHVISKSDLAQKEINTIGGGLLGGLIGYGTSKYLVGSKNKTHHVLSALAGAGLGAGAGYMIAGKQQREKWLEDGAREATRRGYTGEKARAFAHEFANQTAKIMEYDKRPFYDKLLDKNMGFWENVFMQRERDAGDAADNIINGRPNTELDLGKTIAATLISGGVGTAGFMGARKGFNALKPAHIKEYDRLVKLIGTSGNAQDKFNALSELNNLIASHEHKNLSQARLDWLEKQMKSLVGKTVNVVDSSGNIVPKTLSMADIRANSAVIAGIQDRLNIINNQILNNRSLWDRIKGYKWINQLKRKARRRTPFIP